MMRIEESERGGQLVLQIEGRLAGPFVAELEACWQLARWSHPDRGIAVDLGNVTCVDRIGRDLLQRMHGSGVPFLRAGIALQDILDQVKERPQCS